MANGYSQLSATEYPVRKFHFCDLKLCLSKLRSWPPSSRHKHPSLYYAPDPLTCYLEDVKGAGRVEPALIHLVQIKNFPLSDTLWGTFTFLRFFQPFICSSLPHYPLTWIDYLHLGGDSKLLVWKLWEQTSREETRNEKSSPKKS